MQSKKLTYSQWEQMHKKIIKNKLLEIACCGMCAAFPVLLLAHYVFFGYM